jgi:hypothetical protein
MNIIVLGVKGAIYSVGCEMCEIKCGTENVVFVVKDVIGIAVLLL